MSGTGRSLPEGRSPSQVQIATPRGWPRGRSAAGRSWHLTIEAKTSLSQNNLWSQAQAAIRYPQTWGKRRSEDGGGRPAKRARANPFVVMAPYRYGPKRLNVPQRPPAAYPYRWRRPRTVAQKASAALSLARRLAAEEEPKVLATNFASQDFFAGPLSTSLVAIAQGDGQSDRSGLRVNLKRLDLKVRCLSTAYSNMTYRLIVFQDLQTIAGTAPTIGNLLTGSNTLAAYNPQYTNRFRVLYDKRVTINKNYTEQDTAVSFDVSLKNFAQRGLIQWNSNSSADVSKNWLYCFLLCDYAIQGNMVTTVAAADEAEYSMQAMTYYTDD